MNSQLAKLTSKGQLTLPKSVREKLNLDKGSYIAIYLEKDQIVIKKVNPRKPLGNGDPIRDMPGVFHDGCGKDDGSNENKTESRQESMKECKVTSIREAAGWKPSL
ncbi:MAG: AbrB/MazE/SpoVT family DNA-binding domain-containing protein [Bacillota bacterium]